jgi:hypothetical protein
VFFKEGKRREGERWTYRERIYLPPVFFKEEKKEREREGGGGGEEREALASPFSRVLK